MFLTLNVYGRLPRGSMNWPLVAVLNGTDDNAKKTERNEKKIIIKGNSFMYDRIQVIQHKTMHNINDVWKGLRSKSLKIAPALRTKFHRV